MTSDEPDDWMVVVPTRGDAASALRIGDNIAGRIDAVPVMVVRNGAVSGEAAWASLIRRPHVEVVDRQGGGVSRARNAVLDAAPARTVVFVDDDVIVSEPALRTLVARQRASGATISTARVLPADAQHHGLFDTDLGFDRGENDGIWRTDADETPVGPLDVWQMGVGATFAVDLPLLDAGPATVRFDERLSNGRFCGGSEDVDFFYAAYHLGHVVTYVAEAVVGHVFPASSAAVSAKCRQYALSDGAFYAKWAGHLSSADLHGEVTGWLGRIAKGAADRARGRPAVPVTGLLAEPLYKLVGGLTWTLFRRQSS